MLHIFEAAPSRHGQREKSSALRAGVHVGAAENARVNMTPSRASASNAGVLRFWPVYDVA